MPLEVGCTGLRGHGCPRLWGEAPGVGSLKQPVRAVSRLPHHPHLPPPPPSPPFPNTPIFPHPQLQQGLPGAACDMGHARTSGQGRTLRAPWSPPARAAPSLAGVQVPASPHQAHFFRGAWFWWELGGGLYGCSGPKCCSWNMRGGQCGVWVPHHPTRSLTSPHPGYSWGRRGGNRLIPEFQ